MQVRVLGICGSPRLGNSMYLLDEALKACSEASGPDSLSIETYSFKGKKMQPCISCYRCWDESSYGQCIIKNDDFSDLRAKWLDADVVLYSVPVYHLSVPGQLKCFLDRLGNSLYKAYPKASNKHLKVVGCIAQGMHLFSGQELTIQTIIMHAVLLNCVPVSGDGWQSYTGAAGWTDGQAGCDATEILDDKGETITRAAVGASRSLARRAVTVSRILKTGGAALRSELQNDQRFIPFLDRLENR